MNLVNHVKDYFQKGIGPNGRKVMGHPWFLAPRRLGSSTWSASKERKLQRQLQYLEKARSKQRPWDGVFQHNPDGYFLDTKKLLKTFEVEK